jgi:protein phosphatase
MCEVKLTVPDPSLVALVGPSGGGKSTFAGRHFPRPAILSSDELRAVIAGDANDQSASAEAFKVLALLVDGRLRRQLLTVVDATNLRRDSRRRWLRMARRYGLAAIAICFDFPVSVYVELNDRRQGRRVEEDIVRAQVERLSLTRDDLVAEGWDELFVLKSPAEAARTEVELVRFPA